MPATATPLGNLIKTTKVRKTSNQLCTSATF